MAYQLKELEHQTEAINNFLYLIQELESIPDKDNRSNPILSNLETLEKNAIDIRDNVPDGLEPLNTKYEVAKFTIDKPAIIDIKMETGTGKTFVYTKLMYELNKNLGLFKFMVVVPTRPIKAGAENFLTASYTGEYFRKEYDGKRLFCHTLNSTPNMKGRPIIPNAIPDFVLPTSNQRQIDVLLTNRHMLTAPALKRDDYGDDLGGTSTRPYDSLRAVRPVIIVDEPHLLRRDNTQFNEMIENINPQLVIRIGATFPDSNKVENGKDYQYLAYNLKSSTAFNKRLIKGVRPIVIGEKNSKEDSFKLISIEGGVKNFSAKFEKRSEGKKTEISISKGEALSKLSDEIEGNVKIVEKLTNPPRLLLSNDLEIKIGKVLYPGTFSDSLRDAMILQALKSHFEEEERLFYREPTKIKPLTLFFVDNPNEILTDEGAFGTLRNQILELAKEMMSDTLEKMKKKNHRTSTDEEYIDFLHYSIENIDKSKNGVSAGYFAKNNLYSDENIEAETKIILGDKEGMTSLKNKDGSWNPLRFIFSKWALKEGWDNPNIFTIVKLRSSGSENSKIQEVGRGLRLPIDLNGTRIDNPNEVDKFKLTYIVDYSESQFANNLEKDINSEILQEINFDLLQKVTEYAKLNGIRYTRIIDELFDKGYIDDDNSIIEEKSQQMLEEYSKIFGSVQKGIIEKSKNQRQNVVSVNQENLNQIKDIWQQITQKYILKLDEVPFEILKQFFDESVKESLETSDEITAVIHNMQSDESNGIRFKKANINISSSKQKSIKYGEFIRLLNHDISVDIKIIHEVLKKYLESGEITASAFTAKLESRIVNKFKERIIQQDVEYSYKATGNIATGTILFDKHGEPTKEVVAGYLGSMELEEDVPNNHLYDRFRYDSVIELEATRTSKETLKATIFGKIPKESIRIPTYLGSTTSPDFLYILKDSDGAQRLNAIVETKGYNNMGDASGLTMVELESQRKIFDQLRSDGVNVDYQRVLNIEELKQVLKQFK